MGAAGTPRPAATDNPCVRTQGRGPEGAVCGLCARLAAVWAGQTTIYYCSSSGEAKRVLWPACARYVAVA